MIHYLNNINENYFKILRVLETVKQSTGRHCAFLSGIPTATCLRDLDEMVGCGLLSMQIVGASKLFTLAENEYTQRLILPWLKQERKSSKKLEQQLIKELSGICKAIAIFGSYARNDLVPGSDIDLLCVVDRPKKSIEDCLLDILSPINERFLYPINPYIMTTKELQQKKGLGVIQNIKKEAKWLLGDKSLID